MCIFPPGFWSHVTEPLAEAAITTHSFHTVVIDRQGKLAANLEGNQFTSQQLGDLVGVMLGSAN